MEQQKVNVQAEGPTLDVNPANNASAIVLSGKDLEALPDDPDELLSDLEALAGPSAGPNGGQLYIDGFTAGQLPPKVVDSRDSHQPESIFGGVRQAGLWTNRNLHQARHRQVSWAVLSRRKQLGIKHTQYFLLGDAAQEPYDSVIYQGNIGGPINKKASFFFDVQRRNIDEIAVVNAPR